MHRLVLGSLVALLFAFPTTARAQISTVPVASNLSYPLTAGAPEGDTERLFIVGRLGTIVTLKNGSVLPTPFLDITADVNSLGAEQGLLGLAFDPDYDTNGFFYVYYTGGADPGISIVERFTVSGDPDVADPSSRQSVFQWPQGTNQHNGGTIQFRPTDGYLYLALGDTTWGILAQDPTQLLGKLIRIDPDGDDFPADPLQNYSIPASNPYVGDPTVRDEIWAMGFRNPYRFSFDRANGDLYLGDVGKDTAEEIDWEPGTSSGGLNFGWEVMQGYDCYTEPPGCNAGGLYTDPIHAYPHTGGCHSVTGGTVYRGTELPASFVGHYFFSDFCDLPTKIWGFDWDGATVTNFTDWTDTLDPLDAIHFVGAIVEDGVGELYLVEYRVSAGQVHKIVSDPTAVPSVGRPSSMTLSSSPNPFQGATEIRLSRPQSMDTGVAIYDAGGRLVRRLYEGRSPDAFLSLEWNGRNNEGQRVPAGVYFVRAQAGDERATHRVTILQ